MKGPGVDWIRSVKEVWSFLAGDRVKGEGANKVGLSPNINKVGLVMHKTAQLYAKKIPLCGSHIHPKLKANLVKDGLVWADETPFQHLLLPIRVCHRVTDMEQLIRENIFIPALPSCNIVFQPRHLAVVGHISIVAIWAAVAGELVNNILADTESDKNSEFKKILEWDLPK